LTRENYPHGALALIYQSQHARRMKALAIVVRFAVPCAAAALLFSSAASAQMYRPESPEFTPDQPSLALGLSSEGIRALNSELERDVRSLDAFARGKHGVDRFGVGGRGSERPDPWVLYARFYVINFQNQLGEQPFHYTQFSLRRGGPGISDSRIYMGIRKRF